MGGVATKVQGRPRLLRRRTTTGAARILTASPACTTPSNPTPQLSVLPTTPSLHSPRLLLPRGEVSGELISIGTDSGTDRGKERREREELARSVSFTGQG
ncbi:hypothetical protein DPEC_G00182740 [Dallia pectoralis]|uniref:Uncharacterized protein n=1 Tax=Dallia pectoralis TaxID=75939 RepID=A0ACC2GAR7_DALPE|nr:hypothetical protein DPEC_G00182740 [Dallia pectoralis]